MFSHETRRGLAPRSWAGVAVWAVLLAVTVSHPIETLGLVFNTVRGAGQWVGYSAFADCEAEPPHEWMTAKPCPDPDVVEGDEPATSDRSAEIVPNSEASDGGVYRVDGDSLRTVLDAGTDAVVGLHDEVAEMQANGGVTVELGEPAGGGGS